MRGALRVATVLKVLAPTGIPIHQIFVNGSFEDGVATPYDGWSVSEATYAAETTTKKYGTKAAKLTYAGTGTYLINFGSDIIAPTKKYIATGWCYIVSYTSGDYPKLTIWDNNAFTNKVQSPADTTTGAWVRLSVLFTGKTGCRITLTGYNDEYHVAIWDGIMVLPVTDDFGAGNEPTAAAMNAILAADGDVYWEGARTIVV